MEPLTREIPSPLLTEKEASRYLLRSASSLRRARKNNIGPPFIRIGRSIRYPKTQLDEFIAECRSGHKAEVHRA
jgi:predicted DNA-binding transcriptional regulator AlpA